MSNKRVSRFWRQGVVCISLILLGLVAYQHWAEATVSAKDVSLTAAARVAKVWDNVRNSTQYAFSADVTIKTIPLPTAGNIGRFSKTDSLYLEGINNLRDKNMQMALWGGGVSVADRANAYQVRVQNGVMQTRVGIGAWQSSAGNPISFAPDGDFLAFLDMAKNVVLASDRTPTSTDPACAKLDCAHLAVYTFDVDSQAYAAKLASLAQEQMERSGQLPAGASVQMPANLAKVTGAGELWVDGHGLPVRVKVSLTIPPAPSADNRSETVMDIHFSGYKSAPPLIATTWLQPLVKPLANIELPSPSTLGIPFGFLALALLVMAAVIRPGRRVQFGMTMVVLFSIVCTPALQAQAAAVAMDRVNERQATQVATEKAQTDAQTALADRQAARSAAPYAPPAAVFDRPVAATAALSSTVDSDGDGLTDQMEDLIGANPYSKDTDGDGISDYDEVKGFIDKNTGKHWYGDPLKADSNDDGMIDSLEWPHDIDSNGVSAQSDADGDGIPDLYDFDDDGDGVPDNIDISRLVASKDNSGNLVAFSQTNPLTLTVDGLQANRYTYVSLQLRPTNPNQLWYAFNVLNWPHDEKGNMQDWDNKTFFDYCQKTGGSNCNLSPDDNGDIKLVPMLEVSLRDLSSLPRTANGDLDKQLLAKYGINVQPAGQGGYYLYVPLNVVEDNITGNKVAFSAQLLYQTGATFKPEQLRLSWAVQALNETYASPDAANKALKAGNGTGNDQLTVLHAYYTDFYLTGLNVREDHGVDTALVYEDPATDPDVTEDDALLQMMNGLDMSFMLNRDCDLTDNAGNCVGDGQRDITIPVLKQRWDSATAGGFTAGQRWGIPANRLRVETHIFAHEDEAIVLNGSTYAPAILNNHFTGKATRAALLFVREERFRAFNVDGRAANHRDINWNGHTVQVNLGNQTEMVTGSYNLTPYKYLSANQSWTAQTAQEFVTDLEKRYPQRAENPSNLHSVTTAQQVSAVNIMAVNVQGKQTVLSQNGQTGLAGTLPGNGAWRSGFDITDEELRRSYEQALVTVGSVVPYLSHATMQKATLLSDTEYDKLIERLVKAQKQVQNGEPNVLRDPKLVEKSVKDIKSDLFLANKNGLDTWPEKINRWRFNMVFPVLIIAGLGFALSAIHNKGAQTAGQFLFQVMTAATNTAEAILLYNNIATRVYDAGATSEVARGVALVTKFSIDSTFAKAMAVGALIGIAVTWGFFLAAWAVGGFSADSVEFNSLLAGAVASTLVLVLVFFLSLSVIGSIVLAVFAVFDLIALIVCKAGVKAACSLGITEAITKVITDWIYTGGIMIDTKADPSITNIDAARVVLNKPEGGLVVGNGARFEVDLFTYIRHAAPEPGVIYFYDNFFTPEDLRSTTVKYSLDNTERKLSVNLNQTQWPAIAGYGWVEAEVPSPVVGWLVPIVKTKDLYQGARNDRLTSGVYAFDTAQINQKFPLYLNTGLAFPRYDCWFQICVHKAAKSSVSTDLGKSFILDILPATLDGFVTWSQLGPQVDPDGDGLSSAVDPDQTKWDTDGDGVPDGVEYKYGIQRGYGFDPKVADADHDGLNDAEEMRYGTDPRKADTDGDGISDFDEVHGYDLTILGQTIHVTSDPLNRDTDDDGMSDGVERRLNNLDPVRYPFNPVVFNDAPAHLYTTTDDADHILAVGNSVTVSTTVVNGTDAANALLAAGVYSATLPAQLGGAAKKSNFSLLPGASSAIVLNGTATAANGRFNINSGMAANLVPIGTKPPSTFTDIILDQPAPVTIDSDQPTVPTLTQGAFVQPGRTVIVGGTASDPTSYIAKAEVSVSGGAFNTATGTDLWSFPVDIPNTPTGAVPITVRVADAVNNTNAANFNLTIDGDAPALTVDLHPGDQRQVRRNATGAWSLHLTGKATDGVAGIDTLTVQIGDSSNAIITPTAIAADGGWSIDYAFDDPSINADPSPTGNYTLTVTARDKALPAGNATTQVVPFVIDMTPPVVHLLSYKSEMRLTDGAVLTGTVADANSQVKNVEIAFVSAQTALSIGNTLLHLPLNDFPQTVLFENTASAQTRVYCLDGTCPTSGVDGADGTAAAFGGNALLRTFDTLDLPESGLTTALWFNTTCANCGLFSVTQGVYPTVSEHDRDLFLDAGKVCSSILVNATRETRCTAANNYADGQWHQVVHTLGASGNALYVDGQLAASSPTTASTFTGQDGVLIGYSPAAATKFLTGALDDIVIYDGALAPEAAAALYRQWRPVAFSGNQWSFTVPTGIEGYYQIDMRATDTVGNHSANRGDWPQFRGPIDTKFPTFDLNVAYSGSGSAAQTTFTANVHDANLTTNDYNFVCPLTSAQLRYDTDAAQLAFTGQAQSSQLTGIAASCTQTGFQDSVVAARACDAFGHCAAGAPPQTVAYIGTQANTQNPYGSLPNAIERTVLSDPQNRVQLIQRPGQIVTDIAVDESHGKLYWGEMQQGTYAQPGQVWRANLDGSNQQLLVSGLTVYAPEALQIALDTAGNKLYWTKGDQLWWANLDGTLPSVVYQTPADIRFTDGNHAYQQIGDVVVDQQNQVLYLSERRNRFQGGPGINLFNHSLIVKAQLNGSNPEFVAGAGPGCTYSNYNDNLGTGVGAGQKPTLCVAPNGGIDVQSLTVADGALYWTAYAEGFASSAVYSLAPGGSPVTVAPLTLTGNSQGLRSTPLPNLYVAPGSKGVFATLDDQVVRGEPGGEFTRFSNFSDPAPQLPGLFTRGSSKLTALAVVRTAQSVQTQADLAVSLTSPDLVLVNGQTGRYDLHLRNNSALPADSAAVTVTLPSVGSFASASQSCTANGATVTCPLGRFAAQSQQTLVVSFTVTTNAVQPLTTTVQIGHAFPDANPGDNRASHTNITAAPSLTALPGAPYLYAGSLSELVRIPLLGTNHTPEPVLLDNNGVGGNALGADTVHNKLIINDTTGKIATVNPNGTGYTVIANANPTNNPIQDYRLAMAVDESAGQLYWTQIDSLYLSTIKRANLDGSNVQTLVTQVLNQRGLTLDPVRRKLLWVATDRTQRENIIFRANLDGSGVEALYTAPLGRDMRYLAINPYTQKLYWIDPTYNGGALFWADSDGQRVAVLQDNLGVDARGLVVRPQENALYFTQGSAIVRADLDGSNLAVLADLSNHRYTGVSNLDPAVFPWVYINPPVSNLVLALGAPFAQPACAALDPNEPNDTRSQATHVGVGTFTAALCRSTSAATTLDQDVYSVTVPAGQQITVTLKPPADYNLYLQVGDFTAATSTQPGTATDTVTLANYSGADQDYTFTVYPFGIPTLAPYTVTVTLNAAPPQTAFTDAQCAAVDSHDAPGAAGNGTQANATTLTVGTPITGALCYKGDTDFYKFAGKAGQTVSVNLPVRPANYQLYVYRPDGTLFNAYAATGTWTYNMPFTLDAAGDWAVAVLDTNLTPTLAQYQLLVSDLTCGLNDSHEPNNLATLAADITGQSRVFATLCDASDLDYYQFNATAGQQLTINYPADGAGANLVLQNSAGAALGQVTPGAQGSFTLAANGAYRLLAAKSDLSGKDAPYMFQWALGAPTAPVTATQYVYYANVPNPVRVALSNDHTVEPILLANNGVSGQALASSLSLGKLFFVDSGSKALVSTDFDGRNRTVIIPDANPDNVGVINIAVAVDDLAGHVYWLQPKGAVASTAVDLKSADLTGGDVKTIVADIHNQHGLFIDSIKGLLYWVDGEEIHRANLDGSNTQLVRAAVAGQQVRDLALDPFAQKLYWIAPGQQQLFKANSDGSSASALLNGLAADARGLALRPFANEMYYSSGSTLFRTTLNGSSAVTVATLSGQYQGPSNLDPNTFLNTPIGPPQSNLVLGQGSPILSPCALADTHEPNNSPSSATPLTVITQTVVYGALCNTTLGQPTDTDYYTVTVPNQKTLGVTLSQLPADYRLVIIHPNGYAAAFSDNPGLADESGVISNTSGADAVYTVLVLSGIPVQNTNQYKLTLTRGDVPPPPDPTNDQCGFVDRYDSPGTGNGTLATATPLQFGTPIAGALCYSNDVDMYAFDGLAGQTVTLDLPTRPQPYNLTLYDPSGAPTAVISATTTPTYGGAITLNASGRYTVSVSQPNLTPTTNQYQLLVTDQNCVASDVQEPNNDPAHAATVADGRRVQASLCSSSDVDLYHFTASAGQQLTLNYPANATGAALHLLGSNGKIGAVNAGTQGQFTLTASGVYTLSVANNTLAAPDTPYLFQVLLGAPLTPPTGTPYIYYGRTSDLIRTDVLSGTVEPILTTDSTTGGTVIATDATRGWLYLLSPLRNVARVKFDGTGRVTVVATTNPNSVLRPTESLAVDEASGRIYWTEAKFGVVTRILSANGDGGDVREIVPNVVADHGLAVDTIAGLLYWVAEDTQRGADVIQRSNLDGSNVQTVYAAPPGRQLRDLAVDAFARKFYWRDASQNRLLWLAMDNGSEPAVLANVGDAARGFVVRPLQQQLYYTDGSTLFHASLDGSNAQTIAQLDGAYNGVSNLDANVFYPTVITPPGSNLALGFSQPFAQSCAAVDAYEPNDSAATAAAIGVGTIHAALCSRDLNHLDTQDFYSVTVPAGKQISVTLSNLPQNYGMALSVNGQYVSTSYQPGLVDEHVAHVNNSGSAAVYTIQVERFGDTTSSKLPYNLTVAIGDAPPPPPPPPPPADVCAAVDAYDQPGYLGNGSRSQATPISFNTPITAALCYGGDKDYYSFNGQIGQNVTLDLPVRPADYYLTLYNPAGEYVTGIFPGSFLHYGDKVTLNATGRWTVAVWAPDLVPTTAQYQLLLSVNTTCSGLDPYEPDNEQFNPREILTRTVTLRTMLCEAGDQDWYSFPVSVGDHLKLKRRSLVPNMRLNAGMPNGGFFEFNEDLDLIMTQAGNFVLGIAPPQNNTTENLPYVIDVQIDAPPTPTALPNNWSCTTYPSSDIPHRIEDLATLGSAVTVPISGTVTHVGIKDITFDHKALYDVGFGLRAPDGAVVDLFAFNDYGFYTWCGGSNCKLSLDDGAIAGLAPPQFPNNGGTFRPSRNSLAPFNGKASNGVWTLLVSDSGLSDPTNSDAPDTTGDLYGWSLEVCVDNGNPPTATPTPTATSTQDPQPVGGTPVPTSAATPTPTPTAAPTVCTLTTDAYEPDDTANTASAFDLPNLTSGVRTFHSLTDADWMQFTALANRQYTFNANILGGNENVTLALFATDGATQLAVGANQVTFTPTTSGAYFLRAKSAVGMVQPCSASYSVALTVVDPNATPVPTPVGGAALPLGYSAPLLSAAVRAPADGAVLTQLQPVTITVGLNADKGIQGATLFVDGVAIASQSTVTNTDMNWETIWTPPHAGLYSLSARVIDSLNVTATSPINVIAVDLANPTVTIITETVTVAKLDNNGIYQLHGTATDDSQINKVEVRLDGGAWQTAQRNGDNWSLGIAPTALVNHDGGTVAIEARATDKAGHTANATANVIVDVTPPATFAATTSLVSSGTIISPSQVITDLNVRLAWPAIAGATTVYAGWTTTLTATLNTLTAYGPTAGRHDQAMPEGAALYAHVIAVDAVGNQTAQNSGPFYFDTAQTPDYVAGLAQENWVQSGGKQVGQMTTAAHGVQKLFAGWDATQLRLRWQGANLSSDGDVYLYLSTSGSGSTDLFSPAGPGQSNVLSFAANYLVRLSNGITPTLYVFTGGQWTAQQPVAAVSSGALQDVLLPFADLGITNPGATTLKVLGVATQPGTTTVWATVPDQNLGRPWAQYIEFTALGAGIVPAAGVWADTLLAVKVLANPAPAQLVGVGDPVSVTLAVQNVGSANLPQLTVAGATTGGVAVSNTPQVAANIPSSGTVALTLNGTVNADGTLALTLADSYHHPYQLETLDYHVDITVPVNVNLVSSAANPGLNTAVGFAQDESGISRFDLEVNGALTPCTAAGSAYQCPWNAGNATAGTSFTLRGKATDAHGNSAWSAPVSVQVDAAPPQLILTPETVAALSDGRLSDKERTLTGIVSDTVAAASAQLCTGATTSTCSSQTVLADGRWTLVAPALGDGVTATLTFVGYDVAGNASQPLTKTVLVDSIGPQFGPATVTPSLFISRTALLFSSGTVTDGDGVGSVQLYIIRPDGSSTSAPAVLNGAAWSGRFVFDQTGVYQAIAVATDRAGNQTTQLLNEITALYADLPPETAQLTVHVVGNGTVTPTSSSYISGTVVPITATAAAGWSFANWSGAVITTTNPTTVKLAGDQVITATFTQNSYTVITATVGNGSIQLTPPQASYHYGDVITVTATAAPANRFSNWTGDLVGTRNPVTLTIDGNKTITGVFTLNQYNLSVQQAGNGSGSISNAPTGSSFAYGTVVTLTATANPGSAFTGWNGAVLGNRNPITLTMDSDKLVTGTFTLNSYNLSVQQAGSGAGSVSTVPSGSSFVYGTVVTLTATANPDSTFGGWSGAVTGASNPVTVTIDSDITVTATFSQKSTYTLTVNVVGSGVVTPTSGSYLAGTVAPITATANAGWTFTGWSGALSGSANPTSITLDGDKVITATFTAVLPTGDVNGDTEVNVIDLQVLINMIFHTPQPDTTLFALPWWQRSDLNQDGQWDVIDLQMLINQIQAAP